MPPAPPLVLSILAALVEERTGIHYGPADLEVLAEKAGQRAAEAGFDSLLDYYYYLKYDPRGPEELAELIDVLVVRESYFFREFAQLEVVAGLLAARARDGERPRVWSAACAAGEEPLTLAMLLADRGLLGAVEVVATDLSAGSLARARAGRYGPRALRDDPAPLLAGRWLQRDAAGHLRVDERLRAAVSWRQLNLTDAPAVAALGTFDVILCRNVLIYFNDATTARVVDALARQLRPGGALVVGIAESLLRFGTSLVCEERGRVFLYRRAP